MQARATWNELFLYLLRDMVMCSANVEESRWATACVYLAKKLYLWYSTVLWIFQMVGTSLCVPRRWYWAFGTSRCTTIVMSTTLSPTVDEPE